MIGITCGEWPTVVTHLRIFQELNGDWSIDGYNQNTDEHSRWVWSFDTFREAVDNLPHFVSHLTAHGIKMEWRNPKEKQ